MTTDFSWINEARKFCGLFIGSIQSKVSIFSTSPAEKNKSSSLPNEKAGKHNNRAIQNVKNAKSLCTTRDLRRSDTSFALKIDPRLPEAAARRTFLN